MIDSNLNNKNIDYLGSYSRSYTYRNTLWGAFFVVLSLILSVAPLFGCYWVARIIRNIKFNEASFTVQSLLNTNEIKYDEIESVNRHEQFKDIDFFAPEALNLRITLKNKKFILAPALRYL
jgi:hypothetical protein